MAALISNQKIAIKLFIFPFSKQDTDFKDMERMERSW